MRLQSVLRRVLPKSLRDGGYTALARALGGLGFIPRASAGPVDFRGIDMDPSEALRRAADLPCLIDVRPEHLRNVGPVTGVVYFPCAKMMGNPFVETIKQYLQDPSLDYGRSALRLYHQSFRPDTIAEAFGMEDDGRLHFLLRQPPLLSFPPWVRPPLTDYKAHLKRRQVNIDIENRKSGRKLGHENGHYGMGPVSDAKGALELRRLISITESIRNNGYQIQTGSEAVQAVVMRASEHFRFLCANGHHRTSALAALGYTSIPVCPRPGIVDRDDVMRWPGVEAGVFTPDQALHVFDMLFNGQPPDAALRWWHEMAQKPSA